MQTIHVIRLHRCFSLANILNAYQKTFQIKKNFEAITFSDSLGCFNVTTEGYVVLGLECSGLIWSFDKHLDIKSTLI